MAGTRNSTTQVVQKAIHLLSCFGNSEKPSLGVAELSTMTGWTQSSVSRLVSALEDGRLLEREEGTGRYALGLQLVALAGAALATRPLHTAVHPYLVHTASATGETANLCVLDDASVLVVDEVLGHHPLKVSGWLGARQPLQATSAGKVLLAGISPDRRDALLPQDLPTLTPQSITDRDLLRAQIEDVHAAGYALSVNEFAEGLTAIAAPIRNHTGSVIAALTVAGPSTRLEADRLEACIALVQRDGDAASRALGHRELVA